MREMTATLAAAAKSQECQPYVEVVVSDQPCERPRLDLVEGYTGTEGDQVHAAAVAGDGSLLRVRTPTAGGGVYGQRVTDVTSAAQLATWDAWPGLTSGGPPALLEVCADPATGTCWAFAASVGLTSVWGRRSADHGATWSDWAKVADHTGVGAEVGLAAGSHGGAARCFVAVHPAAGGDWIEVHGWDDGSQTWSKIGETAHDLAPVVGLGADRTGAGDWYLLLAQSGPAKLAFREWLGTDAWGAAGDVLVAGAGSVVSFGSPRYRRFGDINRAAITYVEASSSPTYDRAMICFTPNRWWLTEEVPWRYETAHGVEVLRCQGHWLIVGADHVWRAPEYTGAVGQLLAIPDERIVRLALREGGERGTELELAVDNSGGWYDQAGVSGPARCIRPDAQVAVRLGYRTAAGDEGVWREPLWITRVAFEEERRRGGGYLVVRARGALGELSALRVRRPYEFVAASLGDVVQRCWWRVCGRAEGAVHGNMALTVPYFHIPAGERWSDAVARLCRMTGTLLRWCNAAADGIGWGAAYPEVLTLGEGEPAWAFGGATGQPVREGRYWQSAPDAQRVEVFGSGFYGIYRDFPGMVWTAWRDTAHRVVDFKLDAQGEVDDRAAYEWRRLGGERSGAEVRCLVVPGLEVGDVVAVTEPRAGLSGAPRTVVGIKTALDRWRSAYEQVVELRGTI